MEAREEEGSSLVLAGMMEDNQQTVDSDAIEQWEEKCYESLPLQKNVVLKPGIIFPIF